MPKITENIASSHGGGFGGKDAADFENNYAVKSFTSKAVLKQLSTLPVYGKDGKRDVLTYDHVDFKELGYNGSEVGGFAHMVNRIFSTLKMPFFGRQGVSAESKKAGKQIVVLKRTGDTKEKVIQDIVNIIRLEAYDSGRFMTTENGHISKKTGKIKNYHDTPQGMQDYLLEWVSTVAPKQLGDKCIKSVGLDTIISEIEVVGEPVEGEPEE